MVTGGTAGTFGYRYMSILFSLRVLWIHRAQCPEYQIETTANTDINI